MGAKRNFTGKVVLISGAAGGLGSAFARRFAAAGARLACLDLDRERAQGLVDDLTTAGGQALAVSCDVTDEAQCRLAVAEVIEHWGGVDLLLNNAGVTHRSAFVDTEASVYRKVMEVNYFGSLHLTQAALPSLLQRRGLILVITSVAGFAPLYGRTGYAAAKHALHGLFDSLRSELFGTGVDVTLVCPGFTDTGIAHAALGGDGQTTSHKQSTVGRVSTPEEVAEAVYGAAVKSKRLVVLSAVGKLTRLVHKLAPGLYEKLQARSLKSELER
jgi:NAD(P)-dependent dehydrogenase (short-subunit alcohol dehydrogenase family)